jgi:hypothetical protein
MYLDNKELFYRQPLAVSGIASLRYGEQVLGVNKLKVLMKEITGKVGETSRTTQTRGPVPLSY